MAAHELRRRRIALLGPTGQIGWELHRSLSSLGEVIPLDRTVLDLADLEGIPEHIVTLNPALIVNAAAYTAVEQAEDEKATAMAVNETAPGMLAEAAARLGAPLVHFSTDYVFDGRGCPPDDTRRPYKETDATSPLSVYGRSKLAGEDAISRAGGAHLIFRTSWIYGNRGRNFLKTMLRLASERERLTIVHDQIGSPTWSRLVADAVAHILAATWARGGSDAVGEISGTYHLSCAGAASWFEFAQAIFTIAAARGFPAPALTPVASRDFPTRAARPGFSVLDCSKAYAAFGMGLPDWHDGLSLCLAEA